MAFHCRFDQCRHSELYHTSLECSMKRRGIRHTIPLHHAIYCALSCRVCYLCEKGPIRQDYRAREDAKTEDGGAPRPCGAIGVFSSEPSLYMYLDFCLVNAQFDSCILLYNEICRLPMSAVVPAAFERVPNTQPSRDPGTTACTPPYQYPTRVIQYHDSTQSLTSTGPPHSSHPSTRPIFTLAC